MAEAAAAARIPEYSYVRDYISDLGDPRQSPFASWMNAAFLIQGTAFAAAGALVAKAVHPGRHRRIFGVAACSYGAGSVLVSLVPSSGDTSILHVAGATAAIICGNIAVLAAPRDGERFARIGGRWIGTAGLCSAALLLATDLPPGACERGAIYSIIGWQLLAAATVLSRRAFR